jgi:hypothetical protein
MQNNFTENPFNVREKTGPPTEIQDPFTKNKTITSEGDLNVNKISTDEEIKNRKFLKITGPRKTEEEETSKKLFVYNNTNKDQSLFSLKNNPTTLFSNPFQTKPVGLFSGLSSSGFPNKDANEQKTYTEAEHKPNIFGKTNINFNFPYFLFYNINYFK